MAVLIDGTKLAAQIRQRVAQDVQRLSASGVKLGLAVVLVGDDPASATYVRAKLKDCDECSISSYDHRLPANVSQEELMALIHELNAHPQVTGILVQMPLPAHLDAEEVVAAIDPRKDVDGFHPINLGKLVRGLPCLVPCTPAGIMEMLDTYEIDLEGKHAVVIGRSTIVGKPMALLLLSRHATVEMAHSYTPDLAQVCQRADIVVAAAGVAGLVQAEWIKPGAVVIDVGMNRNAEGRLCGDVDFAAVEPRAAAITPVPGGVGPMTRAMLMSNVVRAVQIQQG